MPPGGDGYYYFSTHLRGTSGEYGFSDIQINGDTLCTVITEQEQTSSDGGQAGCSATTYAMQGTKNTPEWVNIRVFHKLYNKCGIFVLTRTTKTVPSF